MIDSNYGQVGVGPVKPVAVLAVDKVNGYYLIQLGSWTVWWPGFQDYATFSPTETLTTDEFSALRPRLFTTSQTPVGQYDKTRMQWTIPAPDAGDYVFGPGQESHG